MDTPELMLVVLASDEVKAGAEVTTLLRRVTVGTMVGLEGSGRMVGNVSRLSTVLTAGANSSVELACEPRGGPKLTG